MLKGLGVTRPRTVRRARFYRRVGRVFETHRHARLLVLRALVRLKKRAWFRFG
jgi:hypothetical protein